MEYLFIGGPWDAKKMALASAESEILAPNKDNPERLYRYKRQQYKLIGKGLKTFYALDGMKPSEINDLLHRPLLALL
ncbi:hypothetical protein MARILYN_42 [Vibrio phage Marilyn]|nr:hypothetical protein MARILYN_42 [Vibrio phage Marilyn]WCD55565.1 hypothetical protein FAYDEN_42 [Vibrio phage Fayden]WCD55622.1 hypothetical protein BAYBAE_42 [Vibrio phage Baybae]WCD55681.1 hypothetical protein VAITEPHAGE_42 [Vibrio phage Vaitephage]